MASMAQTDIGLWAVFLGSAVIATAVGHMTYNYAIGQVGAAEASIFINLNPFFALIGSSLLLGEAVTIVQMSGFVLILIGVLFGSGASRSGCASTVCGKGIIAAIGRRRVKAAAAALEPSWRKPGRRRGNMNRTRPEEGLFHK